MFKTLIRIHEIGLRFQNGELRDILLPGKHFNVPFTTVEIYDRLAVEFEHARMDALLENAQVRSMLEIVDLADNERGLVFKNGRLLYMLNPKRYTFWKQTDELTIETYDVNDIRFEHASLPRILSNPDAAKLLRAIRTDEQEQILIYNNGEFVEQFGPGTYAYWTGAGNVTFKPVDLREQLIDIGGQEIMTSDKVTLRLNMTISYRIADALKSVTVVSDAAQAIYREAQLALRIAIGARSLDELLTDKNAVSDEVQAAISGRSREFGVDIRSAGIRDVILPGEMKTIMNQVIEAQKQAEANLIKRREETASARSQANTARLMAENPVLRRMKELEQLQLVLAGTKATFVLGQGDIAKQINQMVDSDVDTP
ncbi:MAG: slipin family protein [Planctomycetes bacterium]|nr:slipin family protein [Planctomycetota bacterium]